MANEKTNKVKYGLKNVYYAKATIDEATGTATYAEPVAWPGAVSMSLDAQGDVTKFRADNINYFVSAGNDGYEGSLETALIPASFRKDILGDVEDEDGVVYEDVDAKQQPFALLFEFNGDKHKVRHVLYNCTATRPQIGSQTTESSITPVTETVNITTASIYNAKLDKNIAKAYCNESDTAYADWFKAVHQAKAAG